MQIYKHIALVILHYCALLSNNLDFLFRLVNVSNVRVGVSDLRQPFIPYVFLNVLVLP